MRVVDGVLTFLSRPATLSWPATLSYPATLIGRLLRGATVTALLAGQLLYAFPAEAALLLDGTEEIVYVDNTGKIRVLDPVHTSGDKVVKWSSPEVGFTDIALGDVNNDGDIEIMGVRSDANQVIIYDPVVTSGANDGNIDGVPWRKLATITTEGKPTLIAAGDFDTGVAGDEFLVGYEVNIAAIRFRIDIYHGTTPTPDGTAWSKHIANQDYGARWSDSSVGDVVAGGTKEVALVGSNRMAVFRPDNAFKAMFDYPLPPELPVPDRAALDVVIAQYVAGGNAEFSIVRTSPDPLVNWLVFRNDNGTINDHDNSRFYPNLISMFTADVQNNGDDEIFVLRSLSADASNFVHLIGRPNTGTSHNIDFEVRLDADNGWRVGAGGNVEIADNDGGKDEIVIMRNNKIRVYTKPEIGADAKNQFVDYSNHADGSAMLTNSGNIETGDLDKAGFQVGYSFASDKSLLTAKIPSGEAQTDPFELAQQIFELTISGNKALSRPFSLVLEGTVPGFSFREQQDDTPNATPAKILYSVDAKNTPPGLYTGKLVVTSTALDIITTTRFAIPISITVDFARVDPRPGNVGFIYFPCTDTLTVQTQTLQIDGTPGVGFTITVLNSTANAADVNAGPAWLTNVSPLTGTVPAVVSLTVDPSLWSRSPESGKLLIDPDAKAGPDPAAWRNVGISILCANTQNFLPVLHK